MASNRSEIKLFYLSFSIFQFANSIAQIFVPLYFYNKGFSIFYIIIFFAVSQAGRLFFLPASAWLSSSFGAKKIMSHSFILSVAYYFLLAKVESVSAIFFVTAITFGAIQALQWLPFLVHLSKISPNEDKGKIYGRLNMYSSIANGLGPVIGGLAISAWGFGYIFYLVIALIIPAIYLMVITPEVSKIRKINFKLISPRKIYPDMIGNGGFNIQLYLGNTLWPIFMFLVLPQYGTIGFVQTASLLISIITFHLIGKWTDKFRRKTVLFWGSVSNCLVGCIKIFAGSFLGVFLVNSASIFTGALQAIPWSVKLQEHMDREPRTEYVAYFEMGGALITLAGLLLFAYLTSHLSLNSVLIIGIIASSVSGLFVNIIRE